MLLILDFNDLLEVKNKMKDLESIFYTLKMVVIKGSRV